MSVTGSRGKAFKWMEQKNQYLSGKAPIELVETEEGASQVIAYIERYQKLVADTP